MNKGTVFDIKRYAIHDGHGIRTTVFLKGCPLRCPWCHNPEGQNPDPETIARATPVEDDADAATHETVGQVMTTQEIVRRIEDDILFFDESGGGVTFSGGEPLAQPEFLSSLLDACRKLEVHTCLDTCGYASPEIFASLIDRVDLFLYDVKFIDDRQHTKYTGVSNRPILENLKALDEAKKRVVIRFLAIPGITDTDENVFAVADFVASLGNLRQVSLLAYHRMASEKYRRLGRKNHMRDVPVPSKEKMKSIRDSFERRGIKVTQGA